jgi:hypothetical protein
MNRGEVLLNDPIKLSAALAWTLSFVSSIGTERCLFGKSGNELEISEIYNTLVTPQAWVLSIWKVMFIGEAIGLAKISFMDESARVNSILVPFCYACILQALWSILYSRKFLLLSALSSTGIAYYLMITNDAILAEPSTKLPLLTEVIFTYPIRIHFAWIAVTTLINWNMVLVSFRLRGLLVFPALWSTWTAAAIASFRAMFLGDCIFPAVIAWAISGMSSKIRTDPPHDFVEDKILLENLAATYDLLSNNMWVLSVISLCIDGAFALFDEGPFRQWAAEELSGATWYIFVVVVCSVLYFYYEEWRIRVSFRSKLHQISSMDRLQRKVSSRERLDRKLMKPKSMSER